LKNEARANHTFGRISPVFSFRKVWRPRGEYALYYPENMRPDTSNNSDLKTRLLYGALVGAFLGMMIGTMPGNDGVLALVGLLTGAALIGGLAALCDSFWESLRAAWELVRVAFWRW
jgi:hypothetical protein